MDTPSDVARNLNSETSSQACTLEIDGETRIRIHQITAEIPIEPIHVRAHHRRNRHVVQHGNSHYLMFQSNHLVMVVPYCPAALVRLPTGIA